MFIRLDASVELNPSHYLGQYWTDEHLTWNPDDFGGLKVIRIFANRIWIPDLILYNE